MFMYSESKRIVQRRSNLYTDGQQKIALSEHMERSHQRWAERDSARALMLVTDHMADMKVCCRQQEYLLDGMICLLCVSSPCPPALFKTKQQELNN